MEIRSNTLGKLRKIQEGTVFDRNTFVKEFIQNTQRSKAKNLYITIERGLNGFISFKDDGVGCKKAENLFTLDLSSWNSTNEGFGIGFWSCIAYRGLKKVIVNTYDWTATVDIKSLFENGDLSVKKETLDKKMKGFEVILKSDYVSNAEAILLENEIIKTGRYLDINIFINENKIEKENLFDDVKGDFVKEYDNKYFSAKLSIECGDNFDIVELFYDSRHVRDIYFLDDVSGRVHVKKDKLSLKEPDRTDYIRDEKFDLFKIKLNDCVKDLYISFLKTYPTQELVDKYSSAINKYLDVEDYDKYLELDLEKFLNAKKEDISNKDTSKKNDKQVQEPLNIDSVLSMRNNNEDIPYEENILDNNTRLDSQIFNGLDFNNKSVKEDNIEEFENKEYNLFNFEQDNEIIEYDNEIIEQDNEIIEYENQDIEDDTEIAVAKEVKFDKNDFKADNNEHVQIGAIALSKQKSKSENISSKTQELSLKKNIKKLKNVVWVSTSDVDTYSDAISKAKYCGLKVLKARNVLYEKAFKKHNILHILELDSALKETFIKKNIGLKNKKEELFVKLLQPICKHYSLPINTFVIANIESKTELIHNNKVLFKETLKNTKNKIQNPATNDGLLIFIDRNYLNLSKFSLNNSGVIGVNELKLLMFVAKTIAHELAHLLYRTEDNTINHFNIENSIYNEIISLYL